MTFNDGLSAYLLFVCIFQLTSAQLTPESVKKAWNVENYPNPWTEPRRCGSHIAGFICDPDKMLPRDQAIEIGKYLWKQGRVDGCPCSRCQPAKNGIPIGIALMNDASISHDKSIDSVYYDRPDEEPHYGPSDSIQAWEQFAESLRKSWGFGSCENDALIVMSTQGGAIALGNYTQKLLEGSELLHLKPHRFLVRPEKRSEFIMKMVREIHAHRNPNEKPTAHENFTMDLVTIKYSGILESQPKIDKIEIKNTIKPEIHNISMAQTWGTNTFIAAAEDDDFEAPPEAKIDTSLAFILIISFTVLLVCLIALFLIIWYYRTKTGHIQPSAEYTKPPTDEKLPSDIKTVKYEPCQTDEPGLPV